MSNSFLLDVSMGKVPGHRLQSVFGHNLDINAAVEETIWDQGGIYTYLTADTELFLSSTNVLDVDVGLIITGLTADYQEKTLIHVFTGGQTQESIGNWFRIFSVKVISNTAPVGNIYVAESDTLTLGVPNTVTKIHSLVSFDENITHAAMYTIPDNHTGFIVKLFLAVRKNEDCVFNMLLRQEEEPALIEPSAFPIYQSPLYIDIDGFIPLKQRTDIQFRGTSASNNTQCTVNLGLLLIANKYL